MSVDHRGAEVASRRVVVRSHKVQHGYERDVDKRTRRSGRSEPAPRRSHVFPIGRPRSSAAVGAHDAVERPAHQLGSRCAPSAAACWLGGSWLPWTCGGGARFSAVALEGQKQSDREKHHLHREQRGGAWNPLLSKLRSEHPEQTTENGEPADQGYDRGPATRPAIVRADDRKTRKEPQAACQVGLGRRHGCPNMRSHGFRCTERDKKGADEACETFGSRHYYLPNCEPSRSGRRGNARRVESDHPVRPVKAALHLRRRSGRPAPRSRWIQLLSTRSVLQKQRLENRAVTPALVWAVAPHGKGRGVRQCRQEDEESCCGRALHLGAIAFDEGLPRPRIPGAKGHLDESLRWRQLWQPNVVEVS